MTRQKLSWKQLNDGAAAGVASGRFEYRGRSGYLTCTFCGRMGTWGAPWMENCLMGHLWVCGFEGCSRVAATRQGIKAHRRKGHRVL